MRKATNLDMALVQHAMIQRDTLDYMASNDQQKAKDLVTRLTMAVTDQLVKDGRGNEESSTVLSQLGVVMVGVDTPDYFHYVTKQKNIGPDIEPDYDQLKAEKSLEAHMFLHQREFNCGDFRPDLDDVRFYTYPTDTGNFRVCHLIVKIEGNPGHQRFATAI